MDKGYDTDTEPINLFGVLRMAHRLMKQGAGTMLRLLYQNVGLVLATLAVAGAYLAAALTQPELFGSVAGGYRADIVLLFVGIPSVVLAAAFVSFLLPRALGLVFEQYALSDFGMPRTALELRRRAKVSSRMYGAYWTLLGCVLAAAVCGYGVFALIREAAYAFLDAKKAANVCFYAACILPSVSWMLLTPLAYVFPVAVHERLSGFSIVRRAFLLQQADGNRAFLIGAFALIPLTALLWAEMLVRHLFYTQPRIGIAAAELFLLALLAPLALLWIGAVYTALYAAVCGESPARERLYYHQILAEANDSKQQRRTNDMKREEIESAFKWKLTDIFESEEAWESAFAAAQSRADAFPKHAGKLHESADALYAALSDQSELELEVERLYSYAHLHKDEDNGNVKFQGMTDRAMQLYIGAQAGAAFLTPEILSIPRETLLSWAQEPRFARFRFQLKDIDRRREHTLSAKEERLLAMAEEPLSGPDNIFTMLSDVDLDFGTVTNEKGEEIKLTHGSYGMLLNSPDRRVRRDAYEGLYRAYRSVNNTVTATYASSVKGDVFRARAHNFKGSLEAELFDNGVPTAVYEQLIEAVHEKLPSLKKYLDIRKRVLGIDRLEMYDLYVPIVPDCDDPMPYEEAKAFVKRALEPLGENYQALLERAYTEGWIDVYETPGKTSGAFSSGMYGVHPFVLLNFQSKMDDAFTLGHELGHAMHSYHSDEAQPFEMSQYRIMVAEVASTVNETLMTRYLLATEKDEKKRAFYINQFLESFRTTCFRQTMFAEFELKAHRMAENGEPLTVESLSEMYRELNQTYYDGVNADDNIAIEWMRIPHFYRAFYVYQYATGLCSAVKLAEDILSHGAKDRYLTFLKSGGSDFAIEELKAAGVDLTQKGSILSALDVFTQYVNELDALLK